jgi:predicted nucleic acid-binding protein
MTFLDTGYLAAIADSRDELHDRAMKWSHALRGKVVVSEYVLVETFNLLSRPEDRAQVHAVVDLLRNSANCEIIYIDQPLFSEAVDFHLRRPNKEWSLTDCVSFILMKHHRIDRALAYDKHFEQAGFDALLRRDPDE